MSKHVHIHVVHRGFPFALVVLPRRSRIVGKVMEGRTKI